MNRRDTGTDDPRVKVRAGKGSRPRSKRRPDYSGEPLGRVVGIDRGRYAVAVGEKTLQCIKARELGRGGIVMGDLVHVTGDLSGAAGSLARIVTIEERHHVLRRSLEEAPDAKGEKIIVANADLLVIVAATADPEPRTGMVERCLVAAQEAGIDAVLCMTKTDLANPAPFLDRFKDFDLLGVAMPQDMEQLNQVLTNKFSVLVGHSGVGKSTLINKLIPGANRQVGVVNSATGKGRHTSTSAVALALPQGGWLVDTPGVRSFGLSHATTQDVLDVFPGLSQAASYCLPLCTHADSEPSCALDAWARGTTPFESPGSPDLVARARRLLLGVQPT